MEMNDHDAILDIQTRLSKLEEEVKRLNATTMRESEGNEDKNAESEEGSADA